VDGTTVSVASCMVASVEPRVNGIAVAAPEGEADMGERESEAGAGAVPGAPIPVEEGTVTVEPPI
jgi:hypothetical protein